MRRSCVVALCCLFAACAARPPEPAEIPGRWRFDRELAQRYRDGYRQGYEAAMGGGSFSTSCRGRAPLEAPQMAWEEGLEAGRDEAEPVWAERLERALDEHDRDAVLTLLSKFDDREQLADRLLLPAK